MAITQLSVYLENKPGTLSQVINTISDAGINIRALSLADTRDFGILRLIVSDVQATRAILDDQAFATETEVIAVKMSDKAGALGNILKILEEESVNIEYTYAFTSPSKEQACVVFRVGDTKAAEKVLNSYGEVTLNDEDLKDLL